RLAYLRWRDLHATLFGSRFGFGIWDKAERYPPIFYLYRRLPRSAGAFPFLTQSDRPPGAGG
ncbi:MAG: hypothetical protein N3A60_13015, partial [Thermanaerothrix sp.]|nr:hypothetical protein [Thermanaerothrix sp.]